MCDLNFNTMVLILKFDVDVVVTCVYATHKVSRSKDSKVMVWKKTDRQIGMAKTFT